MINHTFLEISNYLLFFKKATFISNKKLHKTTTKMLLNNKNGDD